MWCILHNETEQNNWTYFTHNSIIIFHFLFLHVAIYTLGYFPDKNDFDCHRGDTNDRASVDGLHYVLGPS